MGTRSRVGVVVCVLGVASNAQAGVALSVGTGLSAVDVSPEGFNVSSATQLTTRLGARIGDTIPFGLIDVARVSLTVEDEYYDGYSYDRRDVGTILSLLTLGGGVKYLFPGMSDSAARPFLLGALFLVIPTVRSSSNESEVEDNIDSFGLTLGGGAEYAFHPSFALGAELGLNYLSAATTSEEISYLQLYSALMLNFYL